MTLEDLRMFVAACQTGNLSAVARRLDRSQSAVSQHITRLERAFGTLLLERGARGVRPTRAGEILNELASDSLGRLDLAHDRINALIEGEAESLTVTTGSTTVRHFLKDAVMQFKTRHPRAHLRFIPAGSTQRCFELIRTGEANIAFVTTDEAPSQVATVTLATQDFYLLTADDDAERVDLENFRITDLSTVRYLALAEGTTHRRLIDRAAVRHNSKPVPDLVFDDFDTAAMFVELGLGQTIVPAVHAHNFVQSGRVRAIPLSDMPAVAFGWAFRHRNFLSAASREFMALFDRSLESMASIPGLHIPSDPPD